MSLTPIAGSNSTDFAQSEPARWMQGGFGLDTLVVPYRGYIDKLNAFLSSRTRWAPSGLDGNMFLESWPNDQHKQAPTVELRYTGRRGGNCSGTGRTDGGHTVQNVTYTHPAGMLIINITAKVPTSTHTWLSRTPKTGGETPTVSTTDIIVLHARYSINPQYSGLYPTTFQGTLNWFDKVTIVNTTYAELVPNQYYANTRVAQIVLQSIEI